MKKKIKLKGHLKNYMYWPLMLTILLACMNVPMYFVNEGAALLVSIFLGIYLIVVVISYNVNKPVLVNELINFATQYGTVQKKLLNEFEIPYALLDYNGKVLWVNEKFTEITGKTKNFHKSITSIFPGITRELIQQEQFVEDVNMVWQEHNFRIEMSKIYFEEMAENSSIVSIEEDERDGPGAGGQPCRHRRGTGFWNDGVLLSALLSAGVHLYDHGRYVPEHSLSIRIK